MASIFVKFSSQSSVSDQLNRTETDWLSVSQCFYPQCVPPEPWSGCSKPVSLCEPSNVNDLAQAGPRSGSSNV